MSTVKELNDDLDYANAELKKAEARVEKLERTLKYIARDAREALLGSAGLVKIARAAEKALGEAELQE